MNATYRPDPEELELVEVVVEAARAAKGRDVVVLEVGQLTSFADYLVFISGRSDRQVQGICNRIMDGVAAHNPAIVGTAEGLEEGQWVPIDFGSVIVHVFYEPIREHFNIESLWTKAKRFELDDSCSVRNVVRFAA